MLFVLIALSLLTAVHNIQAQELMPGDVQETKTTKEDKAELRKETYYILKSLDPKVAKRLEDLRENNPNRLNRYLDRALPRVRKLIEFKRTDEQLYAAGLESAKAKYQIRRLTVLLNHQVKNERMDKAVQTRDQIHEYLKKQVNAELAINQRQLQLLEARIEKARKELKVFAEEKDDRISEELRKIEQQALNNANAGNDE